MFQMQGIETLDPRVLPFPQREEESTRQLVQSLSGGAAQPDMQGEIPGGHQRRGSEEAKGYDQAVQNLQCGNSIGRGSRSQIRDDTWDVVPTLQPWIRAVSGQFRVIAQGRTVFGA